MTTALTAPEQLGKSVAESIIVTFDFTKRLDSAETLVTVTDVTQTNNTDGATEVTIGDPTINSVSVTVDGVTIAAGKAVRVLVSSGQSVVHYSLRATVVTSTPQTFELIGDLLVSNT
jgi:hypothetical protein